MHKCQPLLFLYFNSIIDDNNFLYFSRRDNKRKAAIASRFLVVSSVGQRGNEAKVGRCCDFCETQKGDLLPWQFKPRMTPLLV